MSVSDTMRGVVLAVMMLFFQLFYIYIAMLASVEIKIAEWRGVHEQR